MYSIRAENGITKYGIYDFIIDTNKDLEDFKVLKNKILPGSTIFVIETSTKYMLNNQYQWKAIKSSSSSSGSSDGGNNSSSTGGNNDSPSTNYVEIIYDGGDLDEA